ncbi:Mlo-related protein [Macleaya cordata]|uniref:MLO-like protein n=1 Tax=Macleaya cordata TaxID=56857 RepID=A0A200QKZ7_MACCD|nr:Mlo-related protein [Macleaya cordata]
MAEIDDDDQQRSLEQTPVWAVSIVCLVLILLSLLIERGLHCLTKFLKRRKRKSLNKAISKIETAELMIMGFISLLLTVGEVPISKICVSKAVGNSFLPCKDPIDDASLGHAMSLDATSSSGSNGSTTLEAGSDFWINLDEYAMPQGMISLVSREGIIQLRIFILVLAAFHVLYCVLTMCLGIAQMRRWKGWEEETRSLEYQIDNDPRRFQLTRQTSFGRRHLKFWSDHPLWVWPVCFLRQFNRSITKADYCTLRNGFIVAHFTEGSVFDFQKFLARAFDGDFVQVVGISLWIWIFSILFIFFSAHGFYNHFWLPFIPLVMVLVVGTKLEVIITKMCLESPNKTAVVRGSLLVKPNDDLFWFGHPRWLLYLIHFILFQNSFQLAFFTWTWYEYGLRSCFHRETEEIVLRIVMGVLVQFLCGYVTLPLYALVIQMGSGMKSEVFTERVSKGLKHWHNLARQHLSRNKSPSTRQSSEPWPTDTTETSWSEMQDFGSPEHDHLPPLSVTSSQTPKITEDVVNHKIITRETYGEISFGTSWKELGSRKSIEDITSELDETSSEIN